MTRICLVCKSKVSHHAPEGYCPECSAKEVNMPPDEPEVVTVTADQIEHAVRRLQKQITLSTADYDSIASAAEAEIKHAAKFSPGSVTPAPVIVSRDDQTKQHVAGDNLIATLRTAMDSLKHVVHQLEHWRCEAKNWRDVAEKLQLQADEKKG